jgi:hypothetical protein
MNPLFALFIYSLSLPLFAEVCFIRDQLLEKETYTISQVLQKTICETTASIKTQDELDAVIRIMLKNQVLDLANTAKDRHKVAGHLNDCTPEKDSKALIINFAGTGSFNPKGFDVLTDFMTCFAEKKLSEELNKNVFHTIGLMQKKYYSADYKWSGIEAGALSQFFKDPTLKKNAKLLDFATFASEESETFVDSDKLTMDQIKKIPAEIKKSAVGVPTGISMAMICVKKYLTAAKKISIKPKIIVITHSSGGRSAVKFAENLKSMVNPLTDKKDYKLDLVFSMDPVKEVQGAFEEVASQYAGRLADRMVDKLPFVEIKDKPINVWTRNQPSSLYKPSNTSRWVNVYQNKDTEGLKGKVKFGIRGSPIHKADVNKFISKGMGSDAHGSITYSEETTALFVEEMKTLLGP